MRVLFWDRNSRTFLRKVCEPISSWEHFCLPPYPLGCRSETDVGDATVLTGPGEAVRSYTVPIAALRPRVYQRVDHRCPFTSNPKMANLLIVLDVNGDAMPVMGT